MSIEYRFLEPLDVLFLRGNKLFGDPGSYGESLIPPWPSVAAGALRSRMLADDEVKLTDFAKGEVGHPTLGKLAGKTPAEPGTFTVTAFHLARRYTDGRVELLIQPPADLIISERENGVAAARSLTPMPLGDGLACSAPLPLLPVLAEDSRSKPASGYWLTESGWRKYLAGETPNDESDLVKSGDLWAIDPRVGVGLDVSTRRAADGRLFSVQAVAMTKQGNRIRIGKQSGKPIQSDYDVGFLVGVAGADLPQDGTLRLGGDGRAAAVQAVDLRTPEPNYEAIAAARRCRLVLTTPGIFSSPLPLGQIGREPIWSGEARPEGSGQDSPETLGPGVRAGWLPTGISQTTDSTIQFDLHGVRGKLVCAAVPRAEIVSGWDLAKWQPKAAQRAAPAGSVYWLEDLDTTAEALRKLAEYGLWPNAPENTARRAEGFNRCALAAWSLP
ncbi:MAG TPA: type III-B CRISPR module-associated Cmr3 family protein [Acidocella sp.]|nr:type III-B CRISPR module-associated Cmr3 family protein [Acidocella sp.]